MARQQELAIVAGNKRGDLRGEETGELTPLALDRRDKLSRRDRDDGLVSELPDKRRQGIATALVQVVEDRSSSGKLFTSTNRSNTAMRKLCDRLGFQPSGVVENLDNGDRELIYFKRLEVAP